MSHQAVNWAMDDAPMLRTEKNKPDTTARGVLAALAENAHADGTEARPGIPTLVYRTGYDRRTVQRALRRLEDGGLIRQTGMHGDCVVYALALHLKRPASDWDEIQAEETRRREGAAERQRRARARRAEAAAVTHSDDVTVTHSDDVTEADVTHSDDARHALERRDVTHSASGRHALNAAGTILEPSFEPSGTSGDGRQATTGSKGRASSGSAATGQESSAEEDRVSTADVACVIGLMPPRLRDQLPTPHLPEIIPNTIRAEIRRGVAVDQLVARVARRWENHGYDNAAHSVDGPGLLNPVGVAVALVRRGNCTSERCDDGTDLDTGAYCRTCEREAEDRRALREAAQRPRQATFLVSVPAGGSEPAPAAPRPSQAIPAPATVLRDCDGGCDRVFRTVPAPAPAGLCFHCRRDAEAVNQ
jgi:hypothetical protein